MSRIQKTFARLADRDTAAFIPFLMAGDPHPGVTAKLMIGLADAGADLIELGMPFTDPMADGPSIQRAGLRALQAKQTLTKTIELAREFRAQNDTTPLILMGYYNPIYAYGVERFVTDAGAAGVDGVIVVDLPPEEDGELCDPARSAGIDFVRLTTPTTDDERLPEVLKNASGFVYYVSVAGVTGGKSGATADVSDAVARIRSASGLPVAVGFGVKTPERAAEIARAADGVVVGSALVDVIATAGEVGEEQAIADTLALAGTLSEAVANARISR